MTADKPFTVASLADRWECSEGAIRARIRNGELQTFRIGTLIRIPVSEVERIECQTTRSSASEMDGPSSGVTRMENAGATPLQRPIGLERKQRPVSGGSSVIALHGWSGE